MKSEIRFKLDNYNYYNRAVGIIKYNNKVLIMNVDNSSYYHFPGGHIEINEDSITAITREIKEELNYNVKNSTLFCIQENFYEKEGIMQHGIEYYYLIELKEEIETSDKEIIENDRGVEKRLFIKWVSIDELKEINIKPITIKNLIIKNQPNKLTHIIKRDN